MKLVALVLTFALTLLFQVGAVALAQMSHGKGHATSSAAGQTGGVKVMEPWARATAKTARTGAAYLMLENPGGASDKLVAASSPAADKVELHTHIKDGDIMRMREVEYIEVGPQSMVRLQPGGLHIMLVGLKGPLTKGESFPLTLVFEKAGEVTVDVPIQAPGAMGKGGHAGHGGHGAHSGGKMKH